MKRRLLDDLRKERANDIVNGFKQKESDPEARRGKWSTESKGE